MSEINVGKKLNSFNGEQEKEGEKRDNVIASTILLAFSGYIIFESLSMPIYAQYGPGPGMFPLGLGIMLAVLSLFLMWEGLNPKKEDERSKFKDKRGLLNTGLLLLGLIGFAILISILGYLLTTFILVVFLMKVVARDTLKTTIITAVAITLMIYLIFDLGLSVRLPRGLWGF